MIDLPETPDCTPRNQPMDIPVGMLCFIVKSAPGHEALLGRVPDPWRWRGIGAMGSRSV
jgi:hypothetical protein